MATCNPDALLAEAKCYYTLDNHRLNVIIAALWCQVSEAIGPIPPSGGEWTNPQDDGPFTNPQDDGPFTNPQDT